jgi:2-polyprenyl-3-methyl-5-hydroxy-6-metoxy-1,4-benzoquinol methylase
MMMGMRDPFTYQECSDCGCLELISAPADWSRYYSNGYYSFNTVQSAHRWKVAIRRSMVAAEVLRIPVLGSIRRMLFGRSSILEALADAELTRAMKALDVGCGSGELIYLLREAGFNAQGIDPYVADDLIDEYGVRVRRCRLSEIDGSWDLIMFNHSLEHMPDHLQVLKLVREKLSPGGCCLVRMPILQETWKSYGVNWVQLDAPRHLVLHTYGSFQLVARISGFTVDWSFCDSTGFQFWGSELYSHDIPLSQGRAAFSRSELREFERKADEFNQRMQGDQAVFLLRPCAIA